MPAIAPATIPVALFDSLGLVSESADQKFPWVRSIVAIGFKTNTTQADRQRAVDVISGTVVGGIRSYANGDGEYYVRIPGTTLRSIVEALTTVEALPQVELAHPYVRDSLGIYPKKPRTPERTESSRSFMNLGIHITGLALSRGVELIHSVPACCRTI